MTTTQYPTIIIGLSSLLLIVVSTTLGSIIVPSPTPLVVASPASAAGDSVKNVISENKDKELQQHFKDFSYNLLLHSDIDEFSTEKGAAISSPFGVGYMLANINEKIWNVSNEGMGSVLQSVKVADDYQALIDKMQKSQKISNTLFTTQSNVSLLMTAGSRKLKTETKLVDFIEDWKNTFAVMNGRISDQTGGILDDQLIPKGGWWGGAFYYFTTGAYINTNHYKGSWDASFIDIGEKQFHDGFTVPYIESEKPLPIFENDNYTSVAIKLKDGKKTVVFVLPKIPLVPFLKNDMPKLVQSGSPQSWSSLKAKKIQMPTLNITLLDQHFKKLEALGVNYTFCVDEPDSLDVALKKGPYFMGPIVQSHNVQLTSKFFEVASATGSSLNSEQKMREEGLYNPSSQPGSQPTSDSEEEIAGDGERGERSEFVLPMENIDPELIKALAQGEIQLKKVDVIVQDDGKNDTLSASASSVEQVSVPAPSQNFTTIDNSSTILVNNTNGKESKVVIPDIEKLEIDTIPLLLGPSTTVESIPENTIRFDQPFFWYLYDDEMGPLYYGTIHSLSTYQKEYGISTEEDLWLYDAYKTLLWNCP